MRIQDLSDDELLRSARNKKRQESECTLEMIEHIREVDRRRLYASLKYTSLYHYVTKDLGYSEREAYDRINAMRTIREMPSIESKVVEGRISLTALAQATSAIRAETKIARTEHGTLPTKERKMQLIEAVEGLSRREAQGTLQKLTGLDLTPKETFRAKGDLFEIKMTIGPELNEKLKKLKGWLAHSNPDLSTSALIEKLCDDAIAAHEKRLQTTRKSAAKISQPDKERSGKAARSDQGVQSDKDLRSDKDVRSDKGSRSGKKPSVSEVQKRISLKARVKKQVWLRAHSRCEKCGSTHALQIDHISPLVRNGSNAPDNLRLLCRSCNQRAAIETLGITQMQRYMAEWLRVKNERFMAGDEKCFLITLNIA